MKSSRFDSSSVNPASSSISMSWKPRPRKAAELLTAAAVSARSPCWRSIFAFRSTICVSKSSFSARVCSSRLSSSSACSDVYSPCSCARSIWRSVASTAWPGSSSSSSTTTPKSRRSFAFLSAKSVSISTMSSLAPAHIIRLRTLPRSSGTVMILSVFAWKRAAHDTVSILSDAPWNMYGKGKVWNDSTSSSTARASAVKKAM